EDLVHQVAGCHQDGDRGGGAGRDADVGEQRRVGEAGIDGGVVVDADDLGLDEIAADVVEGRGQLQVVPEVVVGDGGTGDMAVEAAYGAGGRNRVAGDEVVREQGLSRLRKEGIDHHGSAVIGVGVPGRGAGEGQAVAEDGVVDDPRGGVVEVDPAAEQRGRVAEDQVVGEGDVSVDHDAAATVVGTIAEDDVAGDEGAVCAVHPDAAPLADLALGDVAGDGVGLDAGMGDDHAGAIPLDVDAAADPVGLGAGQHVSGDDVVADGCVSQDEHASTGNATGGRTHLAGAAGDAAVADGEVGAEAAARAAGEHDGGVAGAAAIDGRGGRAVAQD